MSYCGNWKIIEISFPIESVLFRMIYFRIRIILLQYIAHEHVSIQVIVS